MPGSDQPQLPSIVMGTLVPGEGIKWKLESFAMMRVLVFFFSIPH
jgi:hypothetical protein